MHAAALSRLRALTATEGAEAPTRVGRASHGRPAAALPSARPGTAPLAPPPRAGLQRGQVLPRSDAPNEAEPSPLDVRYCRINAAQSGRRYYDTEPVSPPALPGCCTRECCPPRPPCPRPSETSCPRVNSLRAKLDTRVITSSMSSRSVVRGGPVGAPPVGPSRGSRWPCCAWVATASSSRPERALPLYDVVRDDPMYGAERLHRLAILLLHAARAPSVDGWAISRARALPTQTQSRLFIDLG